jgi:hypothetical protein
MAMTLGRALADTLHDFHIGGYIFGCEADAEQITVWRSVQTSDGKSVAMFQDSETGEITDVCRVAETFDLNTRTA